MRRCAGILLPVSSLPSAHGIGCFSKEAYNFIDWIKGAGQTYWQVLPLGPTGYKDSPYQSFSSFAGNPYFISLEELEKEGLLTEKELEDADFGDNTEKVNYGKIFKSRFKILEKAHSRFSITEEYNDFIKENSYWIEDYALFMAIKDYHEGKPWTEWEEKVKMRDEITLDTYRNKLCRKIDFWKFVQYKFYFQWRKLKRYANDIGVKIIGDIPIYVAYDSADVWANRELFQLDEKGALNFVAGCPPDGFSKDGQLWGNPLYDWKYHKKTGYKWWILRMKHCFLMYDVVRIDHFRGFDEYYKIPYGDINASGGTWEKGPGISLFYAINQSIENGEIIAEDLGFKTSTVEKLLRDCNFPGMKVLQFAFDSRDIGGGREHKPHNYKENAVAYTGTHDNQTLLSWYETISDEERALVREYLCDFYTPDKLMYKPLISLLVSSMAKLCIIPMQDYLGKDDSARINIPSTEDGNWQWRIKKEELTQGLKEEIFDLMRRFERI